MKRWIAVLTGCMGTIAFASVAAGAVTLGNAARSLKQFQFTVTGESNASYIVEVSTNLQQWQPVLTNRESGVTRTVSVNLAGAQSYYRARAARSFAGALATRLINLNGYNIIADSFDSANRFSVPAANTMC